MYIAENHPEVLTQRDIAIGMNHQFAEDTVASQSQLPPLPLVSLGH